MEADEKACPFCAETIKAAAKVCKHCGRDLNPQKLPKSIAAMPPLGSPAPKKKRGCLKIGITIILGIAVIGTIGEALKSPEQKHRDKMQREAQAARDKAEREEREAQRDAERSEQRRLDAIKAEQREKERSARNARAAVEREERERKREENRIQREQEQAKKQQELNAARKRAVDAATTAIDAMVQQGYITKIDEGSCTAWVTPRAWFPSNRDIKELIMMNVGGYFMGKSGLDFPIGKLRSYSDDSLLAEIDGQGNVTIHK